MLKELITVLSGVSGHVNVNQCNFVHNYHYGGQGASSRYIISGVNGLRTGLNIVVYNAEVFLEKVAGESPYWVYFTMSSSRLVSNNESAMLCIWYLWQIIIVNDYS